MKLDDICPQPAEFKLDSCGRSYVIRTINISDEQWVRETYGDRIQEVFDEQRWPDICRIVYRLLEDKSDFIKKEVRIVDEYGNEELHELGGVDLFRTMVSGHKDKNAVIQALVKSFGLSKPLQQQIAAAQAQKKTLTKKPTGRK